MPISYKMQALQFGSNNLKVPGHEVDIIAQNQPAPVSGKIADPASGVWDLIFSFESGGFFLATDTVPGIDGAIIQSWYSKEGVPTPGPHGLSVIPFIVDPTGVDSGFATASHYVDFSQPTPTDGWINTDTIATPNVVATAHAELPEYAKLSISSQATSHAIIITTTTTHAVFDKFFVYSGGVSPVGNALTVAKNHSAQALAIYKKVTSTSSKEIGTIQFPRIPKIEWPQLIAQIVNEIATNQNGELYEHLNTRVLAGLDPATRKAALAAVSAHIDQLGKIKTVISGMG